jgi:tryptophan-rich sensory protein
MFILIQFLLFQFLLFIIPPQQGSDDPPQLFNLGWSISYLLIGSLLYNTTDSSAKKILMDNLFLSYVWMCIFIYLQDPKLSLVVSILMVMTLLYYFSRDWSELSIILVPYLIWLLYTTYWNYHIYMNTEGGV